MTNIIPRLIVPNTPEAIAFYVDVFNAVEKERYTTPEGAVVHAALEIGGAALSLTDEAPGWHNHAPTSLGGSPVLFTLRLDDPDDVCARAVAKGAKVIFPIGDQPYGYREGRIQDPFGHLWILSKQIEVLSPEEITRRMG